MKWRVEGSSDGDYEQKMKRMMIDLNLGLRLMEFFANLIGQKMSND